MKERILGERVEAYITRTEKGVAEAIIKDIVLYGRVKPYCSGEKKGSFRNENRTS